MHALTNRCAYHRSMNLMRVPEALAGAFISTFGITEPTEKTRRQAAWFILTLLTLVFVGLCAAAVLIFHVIRT
jgi:hypothetical protein